MNLGFPMPVIGKAIPSPPKLTVKVEWAHLHRLYEQQGKKSHLERDSFSSGLYLKRWLSWCNAGLDGLAPGSLFDVQSKGQAGRLPVSKQRLTWLRLGFLLQYSYAT